MSFKGGGDAGGRAPNRAGPEYVRHIPKFLQKYEHLLEKREGQRVVRHGEEAPSLASALGMPPGDGEEDEDFQDQLHGATVVSDERDPLPTLPPHASSQGDAPGDSPSEWVRLKEDGNAAFSSGKHKEAVKCFSAAIKLNPNSSILFSNRSAAYAAAHNFNLALEDARRALKLQPGWAKAHSRIGAALFGLHRYEEAVEEYEKAAGAEPGNTNFQEALERARSKVREEDAKEQEEGRHTYRKRKGSFLGKSHEQEDGRGVRKQPKQGGKGTLSFSED